MKVELLDHISDDLIGLLVAYDPTVPGGLRRLVSRGNTKKGNPAGRPDAKGYWRTHIKGIDIKNHHIVWYLHTGRWPLQEIDHINRVKHDNRIDNLRLVSGSENCWNQNVRKSNKFQLQGVHLHKASGKYRAAITVNGKRTDLGLHKTPNEAHAIYMAAKTKLHSIHS